MSTPMNDRLIFGGAMVGDEPVSPPPLPLNRRLRQYASVLSYNDKSPIPAVKHLLIEAAMKIESMTDAADAGKGEM